MIKYTSVTNLYEEKYYDTNEYLEAIYPLKSNYHYFRGLGDYRFALLPKIYRWDLDELKNEYPKISDDIDRSIKRINENKNDLARLEELLQLFSSRRKKVNPNIFQYLFEDNSRIQNVYYRLMEMKIIFEFYKETSKAGISVPYDNIELFKLANKNDIELINDGDIFRWPNENILPLISFAQHFGLPTSMMDCTYDPYIATYFAAISRLKCEVECQTDMIGVYAFTLIRKDQIKPNKEITEMDLYTPPSQANLNVRSQRSAFLITRYLKESEKYYIPEITRIQKGIEEDIGYPRERMKIFSVSSELAKDLLKVLDRKFGINTATLFPDTKGIIEHLNHQKYFWQKAKSPLLS